MRCLLAVGLLVALVGCGGGGGGSDPVDVSGWWLVTTSDDPDANFWMTQDLLEIEDAGSTVWVMGMDMSRSGSSVHIAIPDEDDPGREEIDLEVASQDLLAGTLVSHTGGSPMDPEYLRLIRSSPIAGTLTVDGTAGGQDATRSTSLAHGVRRTDPNYELDVNDHEARSPFKLMMDFDVLAPTAGAYTIGSGPGQVRVEIRLGMGDEIDASGGTVTFTVLDTSINGAAEGTFDVNLADGGHITGAFDVTTVPR